MLYVARVLIKNEEIEERNQKVFDSREKAEEWISIKRIEVHSHDLYLDSFSIFESEIIETENEK